MLRQRLWPNWVLCCCAVFRFYEQIVSSVSQSSVVLGTTESGNSCPISSLPLGIPCLLAIKDLLGIKTSQIQQVKYR
ncbi:hypothetical protein FB451DRAFT_1234831 [Mycena latifolia]|nr:hypothetical protein FB451DRAFT_1234831 [Mycena latifolia]